MKKFITAAILVSAILLSAVPASAGGYGSSRFGITGGLTSSSASLKNFDTRDVSLYHVGISAELPLGLGFGIQPSLLYQVKGMSLDRIGSSSAGEIVNSIEGKFGYVELPVQIQWGPDLLLFRPYVFAEPFIGYRVHSDYSSSAGQDLFKEELKKVEYGLGVGAGIDIWKLQVSAKWFWNFGNVYQGGSSSTAESVKSMNNFHGLAVSVAIFF
ncbi:MAG: porin family protein [Candidatus Cryptobacteroides sp.]